MDTEYSTHGEKRNTCRILLENLKEDLDIGVRITLKWIFEK